MRLGLRRVLARLSYAGAGLFTLALLVIWTTAVLAFAAKVVHP